MKKLISMLLILTMIAAMLPMAFAQPAEELGYETITLNDGALYFEDGVSVFQFTIEDTAGNQISALVISEDTTVGAALVNANLIGGDESDWGLYVKTINGITADYDVDQSYWAFYIDDEYAMTGVDATEIQSGSVYKFVLTGGSMTFDDAEEPQEGDPSLMVDGAWYIPEGFKLFHMSVEDGVNEPVAIMVVSDKATVGEALLALQIIDGDDSDWGLYVKAVNGVVADYNVDGHYWSFYIDGEYAMTGVDATEIVSGASYAFVIV